MTIKEAYEILTQYNLWRRNNHIPNKYDMPNPTQLSTVKRHYNRGIT